MKKIMTKPTKWDKRFMSLAHEVATWSKDPSTQVGCVLVNTDNKVIGMGYNGFAKGVVDLPEYLNNRAKKYPRVIHSEVNAILNSQGSQHGTIAYVTHPPCAGCAAIMIQAGIIEIIHAKASAEFMDRFHSSYNITLSMLVEADIDIYELDWTAK